LLLSNTKALDSLAIPLVILVKYGWLISLLEEIWKVLLVIFSPFTINVLQLIELILLILVLLSNTNTLEGSAIPVVLICVLFIWFAFTVKLEPFKVNAVIFAILA
jgi:hypothetical protein